MLIKSDKEINHLAGADVYFKCENLQNSGSFKFRGASNAVFSLNDEEARRGVITVSSGNHGTALSLAAKNRGIPATVILPSNATNYKKTLIFDPLKVLVSWTPKMVRLQKGF